MNLKNSIMNVCKSTRQFILKNSPEIMTGVGIAGMVGATILAVDATPKAIKLLEDKKSNTDHDLDKIEIIKATWKPYIPSAVLTVASASFIIGAGAINRKRNIALTTAYALSESTLLKYRNKVIETLGEKKEHKIKEAVAQDDVSNTNKGSQVFITSKGNTLFRDSVSGRYFRSDIDKIKKAVNELNRKMTYQNYISLNELYDAIDLSDIKSGEDLGWNLDDGLIEIDFDTCLAENDEPCVVLDYLVAPRYAYDKLL